MWPGIRPATGWIANVTSIPFASSTSASSCTACCACATAMPYPGTITTFCAYESRIATSSGGERPDRAVDRARSPGARLNLAERAEEHVPDRAVHRPAHHHREQRSRRADEGAADDQDVRVELEARRGRREAR